MKRTLLILFLLFCSAAYADLIWNGATVQSINGRDVRADGGGGGGGGNPEGLIALYDFNNDLTDTSLSSHNLTAAGVGSYSPDPWGNIDGAWESNTTANNSARIPDADADDFEFTDAFTVHAWVYGTGDSIILAAKFDQPDDESWDVQYANSGNYDLTVRVGDNGTTHSTYRNNSVADINEWWFVAATYEGGLVLETNVYSGLVDNDALVLDDTSPLTTTEASIFAPNSEDFRINAYEGNANAVGDAIIGQIGIWDRALSSAELAKIYNRGRAYSFDEIVADAPALLIDENFEGSGVATDWSANAGTPDWDEIDGAAPLLGVESLGIDGNASVGANIARLDLGSEYDEVWVKFRFHAETNTDAGNGYIMTFRGDSAQQVMYSQFRDTGWDDWRMWPDAGGGPADANSFPEDTDVV